MSQATNPEAVLSTDRLLSGNPARVFAAFENPACLAQWWGPSGFTNTFEQFEFKPGGRWVFVMHGPNGANYANESVFREIQPNTKIVIEHVVEPWFMLTVTLTARGDQTHLTWDQEFESRGRRGHASLLQDRQRAKPRPASVASREQRLLMPSGCQTCLPAGCGMSKTEGSQSDPQDGRSTTINPTPTACSVFWIGTK